MSFDAINYDAITQVGRTPLGFRRLEYAFASRTLIVPFACLAIITVIGSGGAGSCNTFSVSPYNSGGNGGTIARKQFILDAGVAITASIGLGGTTNAAAGGNTIIDCSAFTQPMYVPGARGGVSVKDGQPAYNVAPTGVDWYRLGGRGGLVGGPAGLGTTGHVASGGGAVAILAGDYTVGFDGGAALATGGGSGQRVATGGGAVGGRGGNATVNVTSGIAVSGGGGSGGPGVDIVGAVTPGVAGISGPNFLRTHSLVSPILPLELSLILMDAFGGGQSGIVFSSSGGTVADAGYGGGGGAAIVAGGNVFAGNGGPFAGGGALAGNGNTALSAGNGGIFGGGGGGLTTSSGASIIIPSRGGDALAMFEFLAIANR